MCRCGTPRPQGAGAHRYAGLDGAGRLRRDRSGNAQTPRPLRPRTVWASARAAMGDGPMPRHEDELAQHRALWRGSAARELRRLTTRREVRPRKHGTTMEFYGKVRTSSDERKARHHGDDRRRPNGHDHRRRPRRQRPPRADQHARTPSVSPSAARPARSRSSSSTRSDNPGGVRRRGQRQRLGALGRAISNCPILGRQPALLAIVCKHLHLQQPEPRACGAQHIACLSCWSRAISDGKRPSSPARLGRLENERFPVC
jgi:hypothetical protein